LSLSQFKIWQTVFAEFTLKNQNSKHMVADIN